MCVEYVSAIRDMSSLRRPMGRPAACRRRLRARDEDGWTGAAPPTVTSPRSSGAKRMRMNTDRVMSTTIH
jgi:hypothetical protein